MRDFEGKTAVITGSASGMGLAFAECMGREGMNIVMADIEEKAKPMPLALPVMTAVFPSKSRISLPLRSLLCRSIKPMGTEFLVRLGDRKGQPSLDRRELATPPDIFYSTPQSYIVKHG